MVSEQAVDISLDLFGCVPSGKDGEMVFDRANGVVIDESAAWAEEHIKQWFHQNRLSGEDMNKTFHKSWERIQETCREELLVHQILHYMTTYGTGFETEAYIPAEQLNTPEDLRVVVVRGLPSNEIINKALGLLERGVALKEGTIDRVFTLLDSLGYVFTGKENINNKEAVVKLTEVYGIYPDNPTEFLRYLIYRSTGETLLIKSNDVYEGIIRSKYNPSMEMKKYGLARLAEVFNRFKPIFLSWKGHCPHTINKISKLSKAKHKPLVENPINKATSEAIKDKHWLDNATTYSLFKALNACYNRWQGQTDFVYRVRNGKSFATNNPDVNTDVCEKNFEIIMDHLTDRHNLSGLKIYIPGFVEYALPTSEKMFIGNIPTGTKIFGENIAAGVYWENSWGARDIDVSSIDVFGKIGWNSAYTNTQKSLTYSGDITDAPNGAVEYMHAQKGLESPALIASNVFTGDPCCKYKIVVGHGSDVSKKYMMDPNKVLLEERCESVQKQTVLGMLIPEYESKQSFVVLNFGAGQARVSRNNETTLTALSALYQQYKNPLTLRVICAKMGAEMTDNPKKADIDLSFDKLGKDTIMKVFEQK